MFYTQLSLSHQVHIQAITLLFNHMPSAETDPARAEDEEEKKQAKQKIVLILSFSIIFIYLFELECES